MKLHYHDPCPGATGYGWAHCNRELQRALAGMCELTSVNPDAILMPVDCDFNPVGSPRAKVNMCLNFFESPLSPRARGNAAKFDVCFVGSSWCRRKCDEAGILGTRVFIQGVDPAVFTPATPRANDGQIRIFSGGKFEYRKGQDLVIAAFREFLKTHPSTHLVCSWFNPWPHLIQDSLITMKMASGLTLFQAWGMSQDEFYAELLERNGIREENFTILPMFTHAQLAAEMRNTDFGVFPNRCEGGTNLVLMEYMASGRPVAANALTGHADVANWIDCVIPATFNDDGWAEQKVGDIVAAMERCVNCSPKPAPVFSWHAAAKLIVDTANELQQATVRESDHGRIQ